MKLRTKAGAAALAVGAALAPALLTAAPAAAAASCSWVDYDQSNGQAVGSCTGTGYMRFAVSCNAVWPYTSWTQRSGWIYINGGLNPVASFPNCPWPAGYSVWAEYS